MAKAAAASARRDVAGGADSTTIEAEEGAEQQASANPESLVRKLTSNKTKALQVLMSDNTHVALAALLELLALCSALSVNAMSGREADTTGDTLAAAVDLDMADWWTPTAGSYLAQVPKARIVEAVTEAVSIEKAAPLAKLKKGEAVAAAEVLLQGTRWLPSPLRARGGNSA